MRNGASGQRGTWATYIKSARQMAGLSQIALARALHIDRGTVYRWESGRTKPDDLSLIGRIADVTGLDVDEVLAAAGMKFGATPPTAPTREDVDEELEMILRARIPERVKAELLDMLERDRAADAERRKDRYQTFIRLAGGQVA